MTTRTSSPLLPRRLPLMLSLAVAAAALASCAKVVDTGEDPQVTSRGSAEVTAELVEIQGEYPKLPNYDYAFVMLYRVVQVHRGQIEGDTIHVAHYNPHKPRSAAADARVEGIGGNLQEFHAGDKHRMALEVPIDDYYMGGVVDRYFKEKKGPIYWAVWTNRVAE
jgi:hypothetical protein